MRMSADAISHPRVAPGARLATWSPDDTDLRAIADILVDWFGLTLLDSLPAPGAGDLGGSLLLLCQSPSEFICQALEQDEDPAVALQNWQARVRPALALNRRHRGQVHLVDAGTVCRAPRAFLRLCGLKENDGAMSALSSLADPAPDPILQVLAQQTLHADIACRALVSEFDAVALRPQADDQTTDAPGFLLRAYRKRHDEQRELDLLRSQQQGMYEQMEALYGEKMQAEQRFSQLNSGLESYEAQVKALETEQRDLRQKVAGLRGRVAVKEQVLQEAGRLLQEAAQEKTLLTRDKEALERIRTEQADRISELEAENHRILNSRSHRLLAPLRRLRATLRGGGS